MSYLKLNNGLKEICRCIPVLITQYHDLPFITKTQTVVCNVQHFQRTPRRRDSNINLRPNPDIDFSTSEENIFDRISIGIISVKTHMASEDTMQ